MRPPRKPVYRRTCRMCGNPFDAEHPTAWYGSDRCRYIGMRRTQYLFKHGADSMTKKQAMDQYGRLFDDPLRLILGTRHAPAIRRIYEYCIAQGRATFTCEQVADGEPNITPQKLGHIAKKLPDVVLNTGCVEMNAAGTKEVTTWRLKIGMDGL